MTEMGNEKPSSSQSSSRVSLTSSGLLFGASTGDDQATHVFLRTQKVMRQRREKRRRALFAISGVVLIAVALAIGGHIAYFYYRSKTQGDVLISKYKKAIALAKVDPRLCSEKDQGGVLSARPGGLLEIPSLGLVAPVVQGTSQSVLEDAVGHDPASPWPSSKGTSVFDAHDITWFSGIDKLRIGNEIEYAQGCHEFLYRVVRYAIVHSGTPIHTTFYGRVVLVTCYPVDALFLTPLRYVVWADFVLERSLSAQSSLIKSLAAVVAARDVEPTVPAPPALAAQGLGLSTNEAPLGTLSFSGDPSTIWRESNAPFEAERAVLAEYFGLLRSAGERETAWWQDLAPGVSPPGDLWGARVTHYGHALETRMVVRGDVLVSATLSAVLDLSGPRGASQRAVTVVEKVHHGELLARTVSLSSP